MDVDTDSNEPQGTDEPAGNSTDSTSTGSSGSAGNADTSEPAYPANTPVAEMNDAQAAAYWKAQSRKHEQRVKALGSADEIKELRAAKRDLDHLRKSTMTE